MVTDSVPIDRSEQYERAVAEGRANARYVLRLYVTGMTARSTQAVANVKALCEEHLPGRYELEVIDIRQQPQQAHDDQVLAVPMLVKELPAPLRRMIGDLSNKERVLVGLGLAKKE